MTIRTETKIEMNTDYNLFPQQKVTYFGGELSYQMNGRPNSLLFAVLFLKNPGGRLWIVSGLNC